MLSRIMVQVRDHMPFTAGGTVAGIVLLLALYYAGVTNDRAETWFWVLHPAHVLLSAMATTALYKAYSKGRLLPTLLVGYSGSVGVATLSDSIIPFAGETLLGLPGAEVHAGFIEQWWLVNSVALGGIALAWFWPRSKYPHAGHVFLSTTASLFHMLMALGGQLDPATAISLGVFLFLAVWVPCCTSDIVFPLLWLRNGDSALPHSHTH